MKIFGIKKENKTRYTINLFNIKIKIRNLFYEKFFDQTINKNIKKYKYVHIMHVDKFNKPFVDFLNRNFNKKEHMILCYRSPSANEIAEKFPVGENVYEYLNIFDINLNHSNVEKVIIHSLFMPKITDYLYKNKKLLKNKCYWAIWGGDLYNAKKEKKNDYVRANIKGYISAIKGDEIIAAKKYSNSNAELYHGPYVSPITVEMLNKTAKISTPETVIQINNSCDDSTLEMLEILSTFKNENIKVTTVLSYGKPQYKEEIIQKGKEIFGEKFTYLDSMMSPEEYTKYLCQSDVLVLNQNRQQGVGNIIINLYYGGKVFVKSRISTFKYMQNLNCTVYDTDSISTLSYNDFVSIPREIQEKNKLSVENVLSDDFYKSRWEKVFQGEPLYND